MMRAALLTLLGCAAVVEPVLDRAAPLPPIVVAGSALPPRYSTTLGGPGTDVGRDVTELPGGRFLVVGSSTGPTVAGVPVSGAADVLLAIYDTTGTRLVLAALGGTGYDRAYGVAVAPDSQWVAIAGRAGVGLPNQVGDPFAGGGDPSGIYGTQDGFVCRLDLPALAVAWCRYVGTADDQIVRDVSIGPSGTIYLAAGIGNDVPASWPQAPISQPRRDKWASLVAAVSPTGGLLWVARFDGSGPEGGTPSVLALPDGDVVLATVTSSPTGLPCTLVCTLGGPGDFYVARMSGDGSVLRWATMLGGSGWEQQETNSLAVLPDGRIVVVGGTLSTDFPGALNAYGGNTTALGGNYPGDAFVALLSPNGVLDRSWYHGGLRGEGAEGVSVRDSLIAISGTTVTPAMGLTPDAWISNPGGRNDGWVAIYTASGVRVYGSGAGPVSNNRIDQARGVSLGPLGLVVVGSSESGWPYVGVSPPGWGGGFDLHITRWAPSWDF